MKNDMQEIINKKKLKPNEKVKKAKKKREESDNKLNRQNQTEKKDTHSKMEEWGGGMGVTGRQLASPVLSRFRQCWDTELGAANTWLPSTH